MGRQTVFPGIVLKSVEVRTPGVVSTVEIPQDISISNAMERVRSVIQNLSPVFDHDLLLSYNITVAAYSRFAAKTKGRIFVRLKNPVESDIVTVTSVSKQDDLEAIKAGRNTYNVVVEVRK